MQDSRVFDMAQNNATIHHSIAYSNPLNTISQISNGYTIQNLHIPTAVQFQAYNVPMQIATANNHLITPLGQMAAGNLSTIK